MVNYLKLINIQGLNYGHTVIEKHGNKCTCGQYGCMETYCSMKVLKEKIKKRKNTNEISSKEIYNIMKNDYESIEDIIEEFIEDLSIGIANFINIFEPEVICLGGSFIYYQDILLNKLMDKFIKQKITFNAEVPDIIISKYGNDSGMIGATLIK